jgi:hypothetical protein
MFLLGRLYFGETGGWLAAAGWLYAPYFAVDLYVRSALEELTALPLAALALYGFGSFARDRRRRHWIMGVAAYAALLGCHFPAALLFTPLVAAFLAFTAWKERSWRVLAGQGMGLGMGLALGAASWAPALIERRYVLMHRVTEGLNHYANHFVRLFQFFDPAWGYGVSAPGPGDGMSFALGWSHLAAAVAAWIWIRRRPKLADRGLMAFFAISGAALCVLMLEDSVWIWDRLPLLAYVDFPWRLLGPASLCLAMLAAALGRSIDTLRAGRTAALFASLALLILPNLSHLAPPRVGEADLALWTPDQIAASGYESTTTGEVTPRWMERMPFPNPEPSVFVSGGGRARELSRTPFSWVGQATVLFRDRVQLAFAYFPGWDTRVDGRPVEARPSQDSGLIEFEVPEGEHVIEARWGRSAPRRSGEAFSIGAFAALLFSSRWWARLRFADPA